MDGEMHVNKVKSIGGAAYAKAKDSFSWQHRGMRSSVNRGSYIRRPNVGTLVSTIGASY